MKSVRIIFPSNKQVFNKLKKIKEEFIKFWWTLVIETYTTKIAIFPKQKRRLLSKSYFIFRFLLAQTLQFNGEMAH